MPSFAKRAVGLGLAQAAVSLHLVARDPVHIERKSVGDDQSPMGSVR